MSDQKELEAIIHNMLATLYEAEMNLLEAMGGARSPGEPCDGNSNTQNMVTFAKKMRIFTQIETIQSDILKIIEPTVWRIMEAKVHLNQVIMDLVLVGAEQKEEMIRLNHMMGLVDNIVKKLEE